MKSRRTLAVEKTWRNPETVKKRKRAYKKAANKPDVIKRKVEGTRRFWEKHPDKKRGGGRPKGIPASKEEKKRIGVVAKRVWDSYTVEEREIRVRNIAEGQKALWNGPDGIRLRKISSETMSKNWQKEDFVEYMAERISEALTGRKQTAESIKKRADGLKECYRSGKHSGSGPNGWHRRDYKDLVLSSSYELAFAKWCDRNSIKFKYQPRRFNLVLNGTYRPDFFLPKYNFWIEIKGAMMSGPMAKYFEFKELYPECPIVLVDRETLVEFLDRDLLVEAKILKG